MIFQFIINGFITGLLYALIAVAFSITYNTSKIFHIAYAGVMVLTCYVMLSLIDALNIPVFLSFLLAIGIAGLINSVIEKLLYQPLKRKGSSHNTMMIVSIGSLIVLTNSVALLYGNENKTFSQEIMRSFTMGNLIITQMQLVQVSVSIILLGIFIFIINKTALGNNIKALSFDETLFEVLGNNANRFRLVLFFISGAIGGTAALLLSYDVGFDPYFGLPLLLNALVAMIIGGFGSFKGSLIGGIFLGIMQSISIYFFEARWEMAITFFVFIILLIVRPQGIFGYKKRWI